MADVKLSESIMSVDGCDSDGSLSWEDFFGSNTEDLVPTLLDMYDILIGRAPAQDGTKNSEKPQSRFQEIISAKDNKKPYPTIFDISKNWSNRIERSWNCRCTGKSSTEAITRCASCNTESEIRSTDIRDSKIITDLSDFNSNCQSAPVLSEFDNKKVEKCELVTCPAGFSTPTTPVQQRFAHIPSRSPVALKRNESISRSESDYLCVPRPLSISSIASSSSSSSGTSSCSGTRRLGIPHKSSAYLASIESLEDDSDNEGRIQKNEACRLERFKCNGSQGSEDSGVHSPCSYISSPSPPQGRPKYCDPHLSYMDRVVMEIIETEGVYVRDLQKIIEGYLLKWRSLPDFPLADRLDDLFSNIEDIYHFNNLFLRELEQCGLDPVKVARCFVRNNVGFSIYTEYCTNYPRTVSSLTELMRQEGTVRLFRERQTALQHTLPLGSYLLKPVQRILKYHLLLQNIVKQYSSSKEGYKDIVDALSTMTGIAQHINEMKRKHEHAVRVQEIQSLLYGWEGEDLTTFGELCAEGTFRMSGAKALRHVFLFDKMVLITKKKEEGILGFKAHINCSNLMLIESVPGEPLSFHVIPFDNPRLQYTLQARNLEQKREWTLQLKRVILENYNAVIPSHARQLVMELGQNRTDDEIMADKSLPKRQHSAPEYLEKRKQDRRKSETGLKSRLRRGRKSDTGSNSESQCNKSRPLHKKSSLGSHSQNPTKTPILGSWRRKSEPGIPTSFKDSGTEDTSSVTAEETKTPDETPEKISIDLNDVEEIKNLEHIVAQLLMQNREFDKILKKQKHHVNIRNRNLNNNNNNKEIKTDTTDDDEDDGVYETLMNVKLVLDTQKNSDTENEFNSDSDYVTLICGEGKDEEEEESKIGLKKQNSLKETSKVTTTLVRRTRSFHNADEILLKISKISLDEGTNIPTLPSVWLRQQGQHLATPSNKAGSLPRSFQINGESSFRDFRISIERPFTIASDKPPFDDMERYCKTPFRNHGDATEDESLTEGLSTPGASSDHINVHPEYKIYRSGVSTNVLKNVLSTVGNKLSHIKLDISNKNESDKNKVLQRERKASKVVYMIAKHYHKTLKNRTKSGINWISQNISHEAHSQTLPVYKQGSSSIGARLANFTDADTRINRIRPSRKAAALLGVRPDSVLSLASSFASSNEGDKIINEISAIECDKTEKIEESDDDSIYERSFEAMDEEFKEAINSDSEEISETKDNIEINQPVVKIPPPVPAKPKRILIQRSESEIVCGNRVTQDLESRKEEEGDTSSQHSTASTVIEISPNAELAAIRPKGWVRHIVGKLQGGM